MSDAKGPSLAKIETKCQQPAAVYIRPIIARTLALNAASIIFAHNHPSGIYTPSKEDLQLTKNSEKL